MPAAKPAPEEGDAGASKSSLSKVMLVQCLPVSPSQNSPVLGPVRRRGAAASAPRRLRLPGTGGVRQWNRLFRPLGESLPLPVE